MTQGSSRRQYVFYLADLQSCADFSLRIVIWLTRRLVLHDRHCPNLHRGNKVTELCPRLRKCDQMIIERTIGLVLGPPTALCRYFLKHCTLTNRTVGTIWRDLSKPPQRRQCPDPRPLWLLVGTPSVRFHFAEHSLLWRVSLYWYILTRRWPVQARVVANEYLLFIYLRATYMLAFLCRIPFNPYFTELYIPLLIFCSHAISGFLIIIPTSETTIFQNAMSNAVLETHITPTLTPPPLFHQLHASIVAHNHACPFLFSE